MTIEKETQQRLFESLINGCREERVTTAMVYSLEAQIGRMPSLEERREMMTSVVKLFKTSSDYQDFDKLFNEFKVKFSS